MISKVAISFCARMVQLESVKSPYANPYGRILYDCIMLEDTSGKIVYICEDSDGDLMICNKDLSVERYIWHDSNETLMEKAITLTMGLMQIGF